MSAAASATDKRRSVLRFVLDGRVVEIADAAPTRTVLQFLREDLGRTGTKEGCAEGDCGACTVAVVERRDEGLQVRAVNACIQFLGALDGKELVTVESLGSSAGGLHPAQQAMLDHHGSQCGFCTPGFVMSLFALFKNDVAPGRVAIDDALAGNLCRCTGYRPIVDAAQRMYEAAADDEDWLRRPAGSANHDRDARRERALAELNDGRTLALAGPDGGYFAPTSIGDLETLLEAHPDATLVAGCTDVGLWVTKQHRELGTVISTMAIPELRQIEESNGYLDIGAAVTLTDAMPALVAHYPQLKELLLRYGSPPIRNAATLGGNIANGSPIGDSMPVLLALGATLRLCKGGAVREVALDSFYTGYQASVLDAGEFLLSIRLPKPRPETRFGCYKISKRFDQDISAVCAAFHVTLDDGRIGTARVAFGGMAETPRRAEKTEAALTGRPFTRDGIAAAMSALDDDFDPISDQRASADYRRRVAANLLLRFLLDASGDAEEGVYAHGRTGT
ncbi:MAG: xanthine dehydrogenase small subunit [Woeseiaceae bacterium]|nr:xanthine dehydrogenase small subunit [Woeseiaceae bacterium]